VSLFLKHYKKKILLQEMLQSVIRSQTFKMLISDIFARFLWKMEVFFLYNIKEKKLNSEKNDLVTSFFYRAIDIHIHIV